MRDGIARPRRGMQRPARPAARAHGRGAEPRPTLIEVRLAQTVRLAAAGRTLGRRGPGHGAGDLRLPEPANRLRCGAEDLFDGAAHVAVPVPERLIARADRGRCRPRCKTTRSWARWSLGYSPMIDRQRAVIGDPADGLPERPDADARRRRRCWPRWPRSGPVRARLGTAEPTLPLDRARSTRRGQAARRGRADAGVAEHRRRGAAARRDGRGRRAAPDGRGAGLHGRRPGARRGAAGAASARQHAAHQGPAAGRAAARRCWPASAMPSSTPTTSVATAAPAGAGRCAASRTCRPACAPLATVDAAFERGAIAVLGWPLDDAVARPPAARRCRRTCRSCMELISGVDREEPVDRLEAVLKNDPTLAFRLMRYLNSPAFGLTRGDQLASATR
ncbi:MAG: hypothetical protein MZW92_72085 [Comamonadaceae bacterium]|nr:hypothetical protein [Comamonadaceae bacterium]